MTPSRFARMALAVQRGGERMTNRDAFLVLLAVCLGFCILRWLNLGSFWGDPTLWIFQTFRVYAGQVPYRDFAWPYPPFSLWLFQFAYWTFGQSFLVAQIVIDLLSIGIVLSAYGIAARLMTRTLALATAIMLACICGDGGSSFELFTLRSYIPALLTGTLGSQLMILGMMRARGSISAGWGRGTVVMSGCAIAILSKPEFMAGAVACIMAGAFLAACDYRDQGVLARGRVWTTIVAPLAGAALAFGIYVLLARAVGWQRLAAGLTGYGMPKITCPWWPNGAGLFGAIATLGEACAIAALFSLLRFRDLSRTYGRRYFFALGLGAIGAVVFLSYLPIAAYDYLAMAGPPAASWASLTAQSRSLITYLMGKRAIFLPVMWATIALVSYFSLKRLVPRAAGPRLDNGLHLVMLAVFALNARGLFGDWNRAYASLAQAAYPLLAILLVLFLYHLLRWSLDAGQLKDGGASATAALITVLVVGAYAGARAMITVTSELSAGYRTLATPAGAVRLNEPASFAIYDFIRTHTQPGEPVVDVAYGGAINFALQRTSPIFSSLEKSEEPPDWLLQEDLHRIEQAKPRFVIGFEPLKGEYGMTDTWNKCPFPALVWQAHAPAFDAAKRFPMIDYIKSHYVQVFAAADPAGFYPRLTVLERSDLAGSRR